MLTTLTLPVREISGQIMNEMVNADDYFKPPKGRKGEEENRKNLFFPRYRVNLGGTQRERLAMYFCDFS